MDSSPEHAGDPGGTVPVRLRLIGIDLDGTLIAPGAPVTDRLRRAVRAVGRAGITCVLVTGRAPYYLAEFADLGIFHPVAVCSNGAAWMNSASSTSGAWHQFAPAELATLVGKLRAALPGCQVAAERLAGFARETSYVPHWRSPLERVLPLAELIACPALKLVVRHPAHDAAELVELCRRAAGGRLMVAAGSGDFAELAPTGADKGAAMARLARQWSIERAQTAGIGDMPNDAPMLRWCGLPVAVAGGHPKVLAYARIVIPPPAEDGVAQFLEAVLDTEVRLGQHLPA